MKKLIEGYVFYKGEPVSIIELQKITNLTKEEVISLCQELVNDYKDKGINFIYHQEYLTMVTTKELTEIIKDLRKNDLDKELGKASIETLSIILYKHPIKRSEIDHIRGVNSQYIIRNLLIRGLIERNTENEYRPTIDLLRFIGITNIHELPEYDIVQEKLLSFINQKEE